MTDTAPRLYTLDEACEYFRRPKSTVRRWVRNGDLPHIKTGKELRFTDAHFVAFLTRSESPTAPVDDSPAPAGRRQARAS